MDMMTGAQIAEAELTDWRKLAQGLHARYEVPDFATGVRFLAAVGEAGDTIGHHPMVTMVRGCIDLRLTSSDAIYRDEDGAEHVVEWVTQRDVNLARRISKVAADQGLVADPSAVVDFELGLETANPERVAPVWAALLTGDAASQGRGTPGDEIRDATRRVPNLWFDAGDEDAPAQRFHIEAYVAAEVAQQRIDAAVAAGGTVVDDSQSPRLTVIADPDGNRGVLCADVAAAGIA
ncbi:4a-hydroxytetrahydrobiopterin dehydratase [Kytococcus sedentarius]|uniref:Putative pterin-4-alpha-carbinolamine dehydratase n=1 Tax=Kytococcus sedentarius (strain ATCC 14392 / DSM 20547 / JCM 11482 / CCUG 33030 / NBRC 15357 / NCTC 11040 / CCM 314 / 541) TaxID=478801 RepID=C7NHW6_KYTSD|nr:VOC family protein [Kytococcus sedentarius]ACV06473.1 pterin-4a-carbinolamine dehydratase [Kytococcus sedentarius DSM 20547]QQB64788.1 4a-hydroxytetrahydrobiopterin dehydratase [Kytococcus sedentarius]STX12104.1 pterin-4-alpha-carbinolamine dehydratase [Kytococcus sedentarius]